MLWPFLVLNAVIPSNGSPCNIIIKFNDAKRTGIGRASWTGFGDK
jgi:hypothetical protein